MVTRDDLPPGAQAAQSVHAAFEFALVHPTITRAWHDISNHICVLAVQDEGDLHALLTETQSEDLPVVAFHEPDFGDALTAIAIAPSDVSARICSRLPLALREVAV